ncbi:MAG: c-di-GMP-related signal transduction protein [Alteromonadaceae bacterium]|jgi:c-di-GMP-related signal transduction protein
MEYFISRQPILKVDNSTLGYRLRFRDDIEDILLQMSCSEHESKQGDKLRLSFSQVTAGKLAFINFEGNVIELLMVKHLNSTDTVINVNATSAPSKGLLSALLVLHELGYKICLENITDTTAWKSIYSAISYLALTTDIITQDNFISIIDQVGMHPNVKLIATDVSTKASYDTAVQLGFSYFEGDFFAQPEKSQKREMSPGETSLAELLYLTSLNDVQLPKIIETVKRDVYLTYKILTYANTVFFKRREEVSTIKQAIVMLGLTELKRFVSILFTTQLSQLRSKELVRFSLYRGRFCEFMIELESDTAQTEEMCGEAFLVGLLSLIDVMFNEPIEQALKKLSLSEKIMGAILRQEGRLASYLELAKISEKGEWSNAFQLASSLDISKVHLMHSNSRSLLWANKQMAILDLN